MKILIGKILKNYEESVHALEIPGIGIIESIAGNENNPYSYVELDRRQIKKLRKEIDKELGHEKTAIME